MKLITIITLAMTLFLWGCSKEEDGVSPEREAQKLTLIATIGSAGTAMHEFNFKGNNALPSVGIATDGTYLFVADKGNNAIKKIDLSNNSFVGWFGFSKGVWGAYGPNDTADTNFEVDDVIFRNNALYAMVDRWDQTSTWENKFFKINPSTGAIIDSSQTIIEFWPFRYDVDANENIYAYIKDSIKIYNQGYKKAFGGYGSTEGKVNNQNYSGAHIKIINDTIVVADAGNKRFQQFTLNGNYIASFSTGNYSLTHFNGNTSYYSYIYAGGYVEYNYRNNTTSTWDDVSQAFSGSDSFIIIGNKIYVHDSGHQKVYVYSK